MPRPLGCQFCRTPLDPARQFAFHVQALTAADPHPLTGDHSLPHAGGQPLRCCRGCETRIVSGRGESPHAAGVRLLVSAAVLMGTGAMTVRLGKWLAGA